MIKKLLAKKTLLNIFVPAFISQLVIFAILILVYPVFLHDYLDIPQKVSFSNQSMFIEGFLINFLFILVLTITRKFFTSLIIALTVYLVFILACLEKLKFLGTPIYWVDFSQVNDVFVSKGLIGSYLLSVTIITVTIILLMYVVNKLEKKKIGNKFRAVLLLSLIMIAFMIGVNKEHIIIQLKHNKIYFRLNPDYPDRLGFRLGFFNNLLQTGVFSTKTPRPINYSCDSVNKILNQAKVMPKMTHATNHNLIVLLIESFTDLSDSGLKIYPEPQKTLRKVRNENYLDYVVAPVFGGKSINSEFELLTGFSMKFIPTGTLPYRELIKNKIHSILDTLETYHSTVLHVVNTTNFGYSKIYQYLGFDQVISLSDSNLELDPSGKYTSSIGVASEIIKITEASITPSFVFSFPNSSHAPWDRDDYPEYNYTIKTKTGRVVTDNELEGYVGAMNHIDKLIELLISHYSESEQNTLIIMIGDHQPAHEEYTRLLKAAYGNNPELKQFGTALNYIVPMAVWSNYGVEKQLSNNVVSMNFLQHKIMEVINPTSQNKLTDVFHTLYKEIKVFSSYYKHQYSPGLIDFISDYEMIQFDQISGNNYSGQLMENGLNSCSTLD